MKKRIYILLAVVLLFANISILAQEINQVLEGSVSYVSSRNVYVKFISTSDFKQGDTLYIQKESETIPALVIQQISSISCITKPIMNETFIIGDRIIGFTKKTKILSDDIQEIGIALLPKENEVKIPQEDVPVVKQKTKLQKIQGRIKLSGYSNFSEKFNNDNMRFRYTLNINANHIANSAVSLETYVAFSHKIYNGIAVPSELSDLKLYTAAARFDISKNTRFWLGRKISRRISNIGATDGLQAETTFKGLTLGAVAGSRPSYTNYGFDFSLFGFGAYIAHQHRGRNGIVENTFAVFEQKNSGKTDRRFMYFQHTNSLAKNLNAFVSFEVDMYSLLNGVPSNKLNLTSLYASLRYRINSKINATVTYDARKNVVYYETFQNRADSILVSSTRQGYRIRMNYKPFRKVSLGASTSYRNRPGDSRPTKNANIYLRYAEVPLLKSSLSITANFLQTSYIDGEIYGLRLNKTLFAGKLNLGLNYRNVYYDFLNNNIPLNQDIVEFHILWQILKGLNLSVSYEGIFESENQFNRIYLSLRKRF